MRYAWIVLALAVCSGCDDGGGDPEGRDADTTAGDATSADAMTDASLDAMVVDAAPPPMARWARLNVGVPVRGLATAGETFVVLSQGGYSRHGPAGVENFPGGDYTTPVAVASNDTRTATLMADASQVVNLAFTDGAAWTPTDVFFENARGIDVAPNGTIRMAVRGAVAEIQNGQAFTLNFEGADAADEPFHALSWWGEGLGEGWIFGATRHFRIANNQYLGFSVPGTVKSADAPSIEVAFALTDTQVARVPASTVSPLLAELQADRIVALDADRALAVGPGSALAAVVVEMDTLQTTPLSVGDAPVWSAAHVAADGSVWLGTEGGDVFRFAETALPGWMPVEGDPLPQPIEPEPEPMPDAGVDMDVRDQGVDMAPPPDAGPPPSTHLRFVGLSGTGTLVCDDEEAIGEIGQWRNLPAVIGYLPYASGRYVFEEEVPAAGRCRGLGLDEFTVNLSPNQTRTAIVGLSIARVLTDDLVSPGANARIRLWGVNRKVNDRLEGYAYCIDGQAVPGGDEPNGTYLDRAPGPVTLELRVGDCEGELHYTLERTLAAGETRSLFTRPGSMPNARVLDDADLFWLDCLDAVGGEIRAPSRCQSGYVRPPSE